MTFERVAHGCAASPVSSTTAAEVSSQEVSIPRMRMITVLQDCKIAGLPRGKGEGSSTFISAILQFCNSSIFKGALQRLDIRRPVNPALGDDAGDELMRGDVERRIPDV